MDELRNLARGEDNEFLLRAVFLRSLPDEVRRVVCDATTLDEMAAAAGNHFTKTGAAIIPRRRERRRRRRAKRTFAVSTPSSAPTQGTASRRAEWRRSRTRLASAARETPTPAASSVRRRNYAQQK